MMRGRQHNHEAVNAWDCSAIDDSPMTASNDTMSRRHPESLFLPFGHHPWPSPPHILER